MKTIKMDTGDCMEFKCEIIVRHVGELLALPLLKDVIDIFRTSPSESI